MKTILVHPALLWLMVQLQGKGTPSNARQRALSTYPRTGKTRGQSPSFLIAQCNSAEKRGTLGEAPRRRPTNFRFVPTHLDRNPREPHRCKWFCRECFSGAFPNSGTTQNRFRIRRISRAKSAFATHRRASSFGTNRSWDPYRSVCPKLHNFR